jgi:hypothetical protein
MGFAVFHLRGLERHKSSLDVHTKAVFRSPSTVKKFLFEIMSVFTATRNSTQPLIHDVEL